MIRVFISLTIIKVLQKLRSFSSFNNNPGLLRILYLPLFIHRLGVQKTILNIFLNLDKRHWFFKKFYRYVRARNLRYWIRLRYTKQTYSALSNLFFIKPIKSSYLLRRKYNRVYHGSTGVKPYRLKVSTCPLLDKKTPVHFRLMSHLAEPIFIGRPGSVSNLFIVSYIREFIVGVTQFLKFNLNRIIIRYNLMPSRVTLFRKFFFNKLHSQKLFRPCNRIFLSNFNSRTPFNKSDYYFYRSSRVKALASRVVTRRIKTLWVNKVMQLTLSPVRKEFEAIYRKPIKYQYRLTRFILKYYKLKVFDFVNAVEFRLASVLTRSGFTSHRPFTEQFIRNRLVYLNSLLITNPKVIINTFDILQLPVTLRVVLFLNWTSELFYKERRRFFFYLKKWRLRSNRPYPKRSSFRIPSWVRRQVMFRESIPYYLEVDFLMLTSVCLYNDTTDFTQYSYLSFHLNPAANIRPLNWKSLT